MKKYFKNTEKFVNKGFGLEFDCSNEENEEITLEEIQKLELHDLSYYDNLDLKEIELKAISVINEDTDETFEIGYYE